MLLIFGECGRNASAAARMYAERYPQRRHPGRKRFTDVEQRLRETGSFKARPRIGAPRVATNEAHEANIMAYVNVHPTCSTRQIEAESDICHMSVWRILNKNRFHRFKIQVTW